MASIVAWPGLRPLSSVRNICPSQSTVCDLRGIGIQMVRVVEAESAALLLELLGREALERRLRGDRHEDGERDGTVR